MSSLVVGLLVRGSCAEDSLMSYGTFNERQDIRNSLRRLYGNKTQISSIGCSAKQIVSGSMRPSCSALSDLL